jgi:rfaE bifunctional protein kinase chain/domain
MGLRDYVSDHMVSVNELSPSIKKNVLEMAPKLAGRKILVIGDVGLDEYILGEVRRISPEAPVPVLEVEKEDFRLGLSGNVAQNVSSLGGEPLLISVVGKDSGRETLAQLFRTARVSSDYLVVDESRPTTRKARIMAKHHHLVRVDYETRKFLSPETEARVFDRVQELIDQVEAIIIEDYAKGAVTLSLMQKISELARKKNKKVLVDPHRTNSAEFYVGADLLKPNFDEAMALSGLNYDELRDSPDKVAQVGKALQKRTGAKQIVMTRGKDGMTIFSGSEITQVPTYARQVFDVTGAGDTVIAALSLGLAAGFSLTQSCQLANFAAGYVVGQVGCVPCTVQELTDYVQDMF